VREEILERMVEYFSMTKGEDSLAPGVGERSYYWGDLRRGREQWMGIRTREEGRMISGGEFNLSIPTSRQDLIRYRNDVQVRLD